MSHELFHPDDIFINRVKAHPEFSFFIYNSDVIKNNHQNFTSSANSAHSHFDIPRGHTSLYGLNVNRKSLTADYVYPFVENGIGAYKHTFRNTINSLVGKRTILSQSTCNIQALVTNAGSIESGNYPISAGISLFILERIIPDQQLPHTQLEQPQLH